MAFKSPGVYVDEYSLRFAKRPANAVRAAFAGRFQKGPVGEALAITSRDEFIEHFGLPTDVNSNDWFQVANFLNYYPGIYVSRAANLEHTFDECAVISANITVTVDSAVSSFKLSENPYGLTQTEIANLRSSFNQYDRFTISGDNADNGRIYTVTSVNDFNFTPALANDVFSGDKVMRLSGVTTASVEMPTLAQFNSTSTSSDVGNPANESFIESVDAFNLYKDSYASNNTATPLTFWARSPGSWGNTIQVAVVAPSDFKVNYSASDAGSAKLAFQGVVVDTAMRKAPTGNQFGVLIAVDGKVVETFVVTPNRGGSDYIEDVINSKSSYVFVKRGIGELWSTAFSSSDIKRPLTLLGGSDAEVQVSDLETAYDVFADKDTYKFDVVIGNEQDSGLSAIKLANNRSDIVAVVGAPYDNFGSRNPATIVDNLVDWRQSIKTVDGCSYSCGADGSVQAVNATVLVSSYVVLVGNYGAVYDSYNNKMRLVNLAGDVAGLRALTNGDFGEHKACAGVNRGVLKSDMRLVFNPTQAHRDILYAHNINPVIALNDAGNVLWGQRTLASMEDNFLSWHVRSMTNMIVVSASSLLRQFMMENINAYSLHAVSSSLQPMLTTLKANGGLLDYHVQCDFNNNSQESMANNELFVDLYIKPTGVAEFICLRMVNTGSETIARVIEREQQRFS